MSPPGNIEVEVVRLATLLEGIAKTLADRSASQKELMVTLHKHVEECGKISASVEERTAQLTREVVAIRTDMAARDTALRRMLWGVLGTAIGAVVMSGMQALSG